MSAGQRRLLVEPVHPRLSIAGQCRPLSISCSSDYYIPIPQSEETLALMRVIDATFMDCPWCHSAVGAVEMAREIPCQEAGRASIRLP